VLSRSVIVVTADLPDALRRCLAAVTPQLDLDADEVIVADGSSGGVATGILQELARELARVSGRAAGTAATERSERIRVLHRPLTSLEVLRDQAVRLATGDVVLFTEAHMVPSPDWVARMTAAHLEAPAVPVIGGSITPAAQLTSRGRALFTCEYAMVATCVRGAEVVAVSAANVSYKRAVVVNPPAPYRWDAVLHHRAAQPALRACDARVQFIDGYTNRSALAMRFTYGRAFAAGRPFTWVRRVLYAAGSVCLPVLGLVRAWQRPRPAGMPAVSLGELGWLVALESAWAAGEAVGYMAGAAAQEQVW